MTLPGETEAGSAGMQPCRGIAWWAHRDDVAGRGSSPFALCPKPYRIGRPLCLENPRPEGAEYSLTESTPSPFHAELEQNAERVAAEPAAATLSRQEKRSATVSITVSCVYRDTRSTVGILPGSPSRNWGSMRALCQRTPKNRCGPVARPVDPTRPSVWPFLTSCPDWTLISERWKYMLMRPSPWSMNTALPSKNISLAATTVPSATAKTGVPTGVV